MDYTQKTAININGIINGIINNNGIINGNGINVIQKFIL